MKALHRLITCVLLAITSSVWATGSLPQLDHVARGDVSLSRSLDNLTIEQSSAQSIINWHEYNVAADHSVTYNLPDSDSISLNRVTGEDLSNIAGNITSNGNVLLINPRGIIFSDQAVINTNSFVASTLGLTDSDFLANKFSFKQVPGIDPASITNHGLITAKDAGLAALVAPHVANHGVIIARQGRVALGVGEEIALDIYGDGLIYFSAGQATNSLLNEGQIFAGAGKVVIDALAAKNLVDNIVNLGLNTKADSVHVAGGKIILSAGEHGHNTLGGIISSAGQTDNQRGGTITALAHTIDIPQYSLINASGLGGGGKINLGTPATTNLQLDANNELQPVLDLATATKLDMHKDSFVLANGSQTTSAGQIIMLAKDNLDFSGNIFANGYDGGLIEVSAKSLLLSGNAMANHFGGAAGHILYDPSDVVVDYSSFGFTTMHIGSLLGNTTVDTALTQAAITTHGDTIKTVELEAPITTLPHGATAIYTDSGGITIAQQTLHNSNIKIEASSTLVIKDTKDGGISLGTDIPDGAENLITDIGFFQKKLPMIDLLYREGGGTDPYVDDGYKTTTLWWGLKFGSSDSKWAIKDNGTYMDDDAGAKTIYDMTTPQCGNSTGIKPSTAANFYAADPCTTAKPYTDHHDYKIIFKAPTVTFEAPFITEKQLEIHANNIILNNEAVKGLEWYQKVFHENHYRGAPNPGLPYIYSFADTVKILNNSGNPDETVRIDIQNLVDNIFATGTANISLLNGSSYYSADDRTTATKTTNPIYYKPFSMPPVATATAAKIDANPIAITGFTSTDERFNYKWHNNGTTTTTTTRHHQRILPATIRAEAAGDILIDTSSLPDDLELSATVADWVAANPLYTPIYNYTLDGLKLDGNYDSGNSTHAITLTPGSWEITNSIITNLANYSTHEKGAIHIEKGARLALGHSQIYNNKGLNVGAISVAKGGIKNGKITDIAAGTDNFNFYSGNLVNPPRYANGSFVAALDKNADNFFFQEDGKWAQLYIYNSRIFNNDNHTNGKNAGAGIYSESDSAIYISNSIIYGNYNRTSYQAPYNTSDATDKNRVAYGHGLVSNPKPDPSETTITTPNIVFHNKMQIWGNGLLTKDGSPAENFIGTGPAVGSHSPGYQNYLGSNILQRPNYNNSGRTPLVQNTTPTYSIPFNDVIFAVPYSGKRNNMLDLEIQFPGGEIKYDISNEITYFDNIHDIYHDPHKITDYQMHTSTTAKASKFSSDQYIFDTLYYEQMKDAASGDNASDFKSGGFVGDKLNLKLTSDINTETHYESHLLIKNFLTPSGADDPATVRTIEIIGEGNDTLFYGNPTPTTPYGPTSGHTVKTVEFWLNDPENGRDKITVNDPDLDGTAEARLWFNKMPTITYTPTSGGTSAPPNYVNAKLIDKTTDDTTFTNKIFNQGYTVGPGFTPGNLLPKVEYKTMNFINVTEVDGGSGNDTVNADVPNTIFEVGSLGNFITLGDNAPDYRTQWTNIESVDGKGKKPILYNEYAYEAFALLNKESKFEFRGIEWENIGTVYSYLGSSSSSSATQIVASGSYPAGEDLIIKLEDGAKMTVNTKDIYKSFTIGGTEWFGITGANFNSITNTSLYADPADSPKYTLHSNDQRFDSQIGSEPLTEIKWTGVNKVYNCVIGAGTTCAVAPGAILTSINASEEYDILTEYGVTSDINILKIYGDVKVNNIIWHGLERIEAPLSGSSKIELTQRHISAYTKNNDSSDFNGYGTQWKNIKSVSSTCPVGTDYCKNNSNEIIGHAAATNVPFNPEIIGNKTVKYLDTTFNNIDAVYTQNGANDIIKSSTPLEYKVINDAHIGRYIEAGNITGNIKWRSVGTEKFQNVDAGSNGTLIATNPSPWAMKTFKMFSDDVTSTNNYSFEDNYNIKWKGIHTVIQENLNDAATNNDIQWLQIESPTPTASHTFTAKIVNDTDHSKTAGSNRRNIEVHVDSNPIVTFKSPLKVSSFSPDYNDYLVVDYPGFSVPITGLSLYTKEYAKVRAVEADTVGNQNTEASNFKKITFVSTNTPQIIATAGYSGNITYDASATGGNEYPFKIGSFLEIKGMSKIIADPTKLDSKLDSNVLLGTDTVSNEFSNVIEAGNLKNYAVKIDDVIIENIKTVRGLDGGNKLNVIVSTDTGNAINLNNDDDTATSTKFTHADITWEDIFHIDATSSNNDTLTISNADSDKTVTIHADTTVTYNLQNTVNKELTLQGIEKLSITNSNTATPEPKHTLKGSDGDDTFVINKTNYGQSHVPQYLNTYRTISISQVNGVVIPTMATYENFAIIDGGDGSGEDTIKASDSTETNKFQWILKKKDANTDPLSDKSLGYYLDLDTHFGLTSVSNFEIISGSDSSNVSNTLDLSIYNGAAGQNTVYKLYDNSTPNKFTTDNIYLQDYKKDNATAPLIWENIGEIKAIELESDNALGDKIEAKYTTSTIKYDMSARNMSANGILLSGIETINANAFNDIIANTTSSNRTWKIADQASDATQAYYGIDFSAFDNSAGEELRNLDLTGKFETVQGGGSDTLVTNAIKDIPSGNFTITAKNAFTGYGMNFTGFNKVINTKPDKANNRAARTVTNNYNDTASPQQYNGVSKDIMRTYIVDDNGNVQVAGVTWEYFTGIDHTYGEAELIMKKSDQYGIKNDINFPADNNNINEFASDSTSLILSLTNNIIPDSSDLTFTNFNQFTPLGGINKIKPLSSASTFELSVIETFRYNENTAIKQPSLSLKNTNNNITWNNINSLAAGDGSDTLSYTTSAEDVKWQITGDNAVTLTATNTTASSAVNLTLDITEIENINGATTPTKHTVIGTDIATVYTVVVGTTDNAFNANKIDWTNIGTVQAGSATTDKLAMNNRDNLSFKLQTAVDSYRGINWKNFEILAPQASTNNTLNGSSNDDILQLHDSQTIKYIDGSSSITWENIDTINDPSTADSDTLKNMTATALTWQIDSDKTFTASNITVINIENVDTEATSADPAITQTLQGDNALTSTRSYIATDTGKVTVAGTVWSNVTNVNAGTGQDTLDLANSVGHAFNLTDGGSLNGYKGIAWTNFGIFNPNADVNNSVVGDANADTLVIQDPQKVNHAANNITWLNIDTINLGDGEDAITNTAGTYVGWEITGDKKVTMRRDLAATATTDIAIENVELITAGNAKTIQGDNVAREYFALETSTTDPKAYSQGKVKAAEITWSGIATVNAGTAQDTLNMQNEADHSFDLNSAITSYKGIAWNNFEVFAANATHTNTLTADATANAFEIVNAQEILYPSTQITWKNINILNAGADSDSVVNKSTVYKEWEVTADNTLTVKHATDATLNLAINQVESIATGSENDTVKVAATFNNPTDYTVLSRKKSFSAHGITWSEVEHMTAGSDIDTLTLNNTANYTFLNLGRDIIYNDVAWTNFDIFIPKSATGISNTLTGTAGDDLVKVELQSSADKTGQLCVNCADPATKIVWHNIHALDFGAGNDSLENLTGANITDWKYDLSNLAFSVTNVENILALPNDIFVGTDNDTTYTVTGTVTDVHKFKTATSAGQFDPAVPTPELNWNNIKTIQAGSGVDTLIAKDPATYTLTGSKAFTDDNSKIAVTGFEVIHANGLAVSTDTTNKIINGTDGSFTWLIDETTKVPDLTALSLSFTNGGVNNITGDLAHKDILDDSAKKTDITYKVNADNTVAAYGITLTNIREVKTSTSGATDIEAVVNTDHTYKVTDNNELESHAITWSGINEVTAHSTANNTVTSPDITTPTTYDLYSTNRRFDGYNIEWHNIDNVNPKVGTDNTIAGPNSDSTYNLTGNRALNTYDISSDDDISWSEIANINAGSKVDTFNTDAVAHPVVYLLKGSKHLHATNLGIIGTGFEKIHSANKAQLFNDTADTLDWHATGTATVKVPSLNFTEITKVDTITGSGEFDKLIGDDIGDDTAQKYTITGDNKLTAYDINWVNFDTIQAGTANDTITATDSAEYTFTKANEFTTSRGVKVFSIENLTASTNAGDKIINNTGSSLAWQVNGDHAVTGNGIIATGIDEITANTNNDTVTMQAGDDDITITGDEEFTSAKISWDNIVAVDAGTGTNTLVGTNDDSKYTVHSANALNVNKIEWQGIDKLTAGTGVDTFNSIAEDTDIDILETAKFSGLGLESTGFENIVTSGVLRDETLTNTNKSTNALAITLIDNNHINIDGIDIRGIDNFASDAVTTNSIKTDNELKYLIIDVLNDGNMRIGNIKMAEGIVNKIENTITDPRHSFINIERDVTGPITATISDAASAKPDLSLTGVMGGIDLVGTYKVSNNKVSNDFNIAVDITKDENFAKVDVTGELSAGGYIFKDYDEVGGTSTNKLDLDKHVLIDLQLQLGILTTKFANMGEIKTTDAQDIDFANGISSDTRTAINPQKHSAVRYGTNLHSVNNEEFANLMSLIALDLSQALLLKEAR